MKKAEIKNKEFGRKKVVQINELNNFQFTINYQHHIKSRYS